MPRVKARSQTCLDACCLAKDTAQVITLPFLRGGALEMSATAASDGGQPEREPLLPPPIPPLQGGLSAGTGASLNAACTLADPKPDGQEESFSSVQRKLIIALILALLFMVVEVVGGFFANSLAIMTDAAHLLSDVSGFGVAVFAGYYAAKKSQSTHTFGYHRIEVLGALASVLSTWLVTGILLYEAVNRVISPSPVNGKVMFILALVGILVNALIFVILGGHGHSHHGHSHDHDQGCGHSSGKKKPSSLPGDVESGDANGDGHEGHDHSHGNAEGGHSHSHGHKHGGDGDSINLRGAVIHVLGDFVQSIGVAIAGALIWWNQDDPRWSIADPICTFVFAALVLLTTRAILRDISDILMERVPRSQDAQAITSGLFAIPGVVGVSDLHVWELKPGMPLLATHLDVALESDACEVLAKATAYCRSVGITHTTIQLLHNQQPCCVPLPTPRGED